MFSYVINTSFTVAGAHQGPVSPSLTFPSYLVQAELMPEGVLNTHMGTGKHLRGASCISKTWHVRKTIHTYTHTHSPSGLGSAYHPLFKSNDCCNLDFIPSSSSATQTICHGSTSHPLFAFFPS